MQQGPSAVPLIPGRAPDHGSSDTRKAALPPAPTGRAGDAPAP